MEQFMPESLDSNHVQSSRTYNPIKVVNSEVSTSNHRGGLFSAQEQKRARPIISSGADTIKSPGSANHHVAFSPSTLGKTPVQEKALPISIGIPHLNNL